MNNENIETNKRTLTEFLQDELTIKRWHILIYGLTGSLGGAVLMFIMAMFGIVG